MAPLPLDISGLSRTERLRLIEALRDSLDPADLLPTGPPPGPALAHDALRASERRYRRLFESAKDGILILDAETGMIVDVNPFLIELLDYSREEILARHVWDLGFLRDVIANQANFLELREKGFVRYDDKALETRGGERVEVEFVSNVYQVNDHRVIQCNIRDVTDRARMNAALQASLRLTEQIINALPARVFWKDTDLTYIGCNRLFASDAGLSAPAEIVGKSDYQLAWSEQAAAYRADDRQVIESGQAKLLIEEPQTTPEGHTITLLTSKVPLHDASGAIIGILGTYLDITALKRAEASEARLATAVKQVAEAIMITDAQGSIVDVNPAFEVSSGYTRDEVIGRNPRMLKSGKHDAAFYRRMWSVLTDGHVWRGRLTNRRKDGTLYDEDVSISPIHSTDGTTVNFVAVKRDVTAQERLEAQLRRSQRLESIGTLAGGVAHDLNNALAPILMATELLRLELPGTALDDLNLIEAGARHGADLVKQLLHFARGAEGERLPVELKTVCGEMERLIRHTFPKSITLRIDCPADLPPILGDATQLHQVLLNLCLNARDAMPQGGQLSIHVRPQHIDATPDNQALGLKHGPYVVLRVTDTGTGILPEDLDRIFDPFFTTKTSDKGTGLGLSTTLGIVKGHHGFIRVYSNLGHGSTFAVYLPVPDTLRDSNAGDATVPPAIDSTFRGHGQTILVVDDEASIRDILRRVLTRLDFRVVSASDGTSALRAVSEQPAGLAAIITDLHMPGLGGISFLRLVRKRLPEAAIIVVSGLVGESERQQLAQIGVGTVVNKPFTQAELVGALQAVLVS